MNGNWTRREFVQRVGTAAGMLAIGGTFPEFLAACGGNPANGPTRLEIFSWWTYGRGALGLIEMFNIYTKKYPNVQMVNGAGAFANSMEFSTTGQAQTALAKRIQKGKPPDGFQVHAGQELIAKWVRAGKMEPITGIWASEGWDAVIPKELKAIVSAGSDVWSVPLDVHRGNVLWVSRKAPSAVSAAKNLDNFLAGLQVARDAGVEAPLALGSKGNWQVSMLFENNLVAVGGAAFYRGLFTGKSSWTDNNIRTALLYLSKMLDYVNENHAILNWDEAAARMNDGTAVATIMGDWAQPAFVGKPDTNYTAIAAPGTAGTYMIVCDSFGMPQGAPDHENAVNWVKLCGSKDGQSAFNLKKGSIPARTDVPASLFDPIAQRFMREFKEASLTPSIAHGSAAPEEFVSGLNDEMGLFVQRKNVTASAANIAKLADRFLQ